MTTFSLKIIGSDFQLKLIPPKTVEIEGTSKQRRKSCKTDEASNLVIHCKHGKITRGHVAMLAQTSRLFRKCLGNIRFCINSDLHLFLPDFSAISVDTFLDKLYYGELSHNTDPRLEVELNDLLKVLDVVGGAHETNDLVIETHDPAENRLLVNDASDSDGSDAESSDSDTKTSDRKSTKRRRPSCSSCSSCSSCCRSCSCSMSESDISDSASLKSHSERPTCSSGPKKLNGQEKAETASTSKVDQERKVFVCTICSKCVSARKSVKAHVGRHFSKEILQSHDCVNLKCNTCAQTFKNSTGLLGHLVGKHNALNGLVSDGELEKMMKPVSHHEGDTKNSCPKVGKHPPSDGRSKSKAHVVCHICDRSFSCYANFLIHAGRVHFKNEVEELIRDGTDCKKCNFTNQKRSSIIQHISTVHKDLFGIPQKSEVVVLKDRKAASSEAVIECRLCGRVFQRPAFCMTHLAFSHFCSDIVEEFIDDQSEEGKVKCKACQLEVFSPRGLAIHAATRHDAIKPFLDEDFYNLIKPNSTQEQVGTST